MKSSGVTKGGEYLWVASTYNAELHMLSYDGSTIDRYDTPGKGIMKFTNSRDAFVTGAHGVEWVDDENMWMAVPPAKSVFPIDPRAMSFKRSIPSPGVRPHGLFMHGNHLWVADTQDYKIQKLDIGSGSVLEEIHVPERKILGMTVHDGHTWFSCAEARKVCTVPLPN